MHELIDKHGLDFDHKRCFYSWNTNEQIQKDLDSAIKYINNFFNKDMFNTDRSDPEYFNKLHIGFEKLNQGYDDVTVLEIIGPQQLRESIKDINYCVHHLEYGYELKQELQLQWNKNTITRKPIEKTDYEHATSTNKKHTVYLEYNEVGKSIGDLWHDNLPANYPGLKNNHFVGPDINFVFKDSDLFPQEFLLWCKQKQIDPYDPQNGILNYPIGKFEYNFDMTSITPQSHITKYEIVDNL